MLDLMTRRVNSHSRANGARGMQSRDPLTMDQIRNVVPSVFAEQKHNSRSERYTYIPTAQIVEHLMSRDFGVFAVSQVILKTFSTTALDPRISKPADGHF